MNTARGSTSRVTPGREFEDGALTVDIDLMDTGGQRVFKVQGDSGLG
jgi:hypothetical protein